MSPQATADSTATGNPASSESVTAVSFSFPGGPGWATGTEYQIKRLGTPSAGGAVLQRYQRLDWFEFERQTGIGPILAATQARFRKPLTYPDTIWVTARVLNVEDDRFHLEHRIISKRLGAIAAEGKGTIVTYHHGEGRKVVLPEELRRRIEALEATAPKR